MTVNEFRKIVLSMPGAIEGSHMNHPDFRVGNKIFATLQPDKGLGVVMLKPDQQAAFVQMQPEAFVPVAGGWGRSGATEVRLGEVSDRPTVREAISLAWQNRAAADAPSARAPRAPVTGRPKAVGRSHRRSGKKSMRKAP